MNPNKEPLSDGMRYRDDNGLGHPFAPGDYVVGATETDRPVENVLLRIKRVFSRVVERNTGPRSDVYRRMAVVEPVLSNGDSEAVVAVSELRDATDDDVAPPFRMSPDRRDGRTAVLAPRDDPCAVCGGVHAELYADDDAGVHGEWCAVCGFPFVQP